MSDACVRRATGEDRPQLRRIQAAALAEPWPTLLDPDSPLDPQLWVCEADPTAVVGYAAALTAREPTAYLPEIAIVPARQCEGFGSALLEGVLADLAPDGFERVRVTAPASEPRLRAFYGRFGFETVERLPDHFEDGDGVLLERTIDDVAGSDDCGRN